MIDLHLVMQRQCMVALTPVVADARQAVDNERLDAKLTETGRNREPGLAATHDQHRGIAVGIRGGGFAEIEPVGTAEIA